MNFEKTYRITIYNKKIMNKRIKNNENLLQSIVSLIDSARKRVATTINSELTLLYWNIGKHINEDILQNKRAGYGKQVIAELSGELSKRYGNNFNKRNLQHFVKFYVTFQEIEIVNTLCTQFSWSHFRTLLPINDNLKRELYIQMA